MAPFSLENLRPGAPIWMPLLCERKMGSGDETRMLRRFPIVNIKKLILINRYWKSHLK